MNERPPQPPEGKLIQDAAAACGLSIREAARRADISYGRWRQIVTGYQNVSPGVTAAVRAPAATIARMASVVGITPERMETEGERADAAAILAEILRTTAPLRPLPDAAPPQSRDTGKTSVVSADPGEMAPFVDQVWAEVLQATRIYGPDPSGAQVFPHNVHEARMWEHRIDEDRRVRLIAFIRLEDSRPTPADGNGAGKRAS